MAIAYKTVAFYPDMRKSIVDVTLDASYAAGGYALTPASLGFATAPNMVDPQVVTTAGQGFVPSWNQQTGKLQMFKVGAAGAMTECVNTDLSASVKVRLEVTGDIPLL
jgi:hypothetical protein